MCRPFAKGLAIRFGKKPRPSNTLEWTPCRARTCAPRSCCIGFTPRNAAKRLPIAGMWLTWVAIAVGTPCAVSPESSVCGNDAARPSVMTVKKKPIDNTLAEFMNVFIIAPPAPRRLAGSEFMIALELGAEKRPIERPTSNNSAANTGYAKLIGIICRPTRLIPVSTRPSVAKLRAP